MVARTGSVSLLATASFVSGAKPYRPVAMQSLACGDARTPVMVLRSSSDGVPEKNARLACDLVIAAVAYDSEITQRPIPALGYRLLLVPTGYSLYRHDFSARLSGPARVTYAVHGGDATLMRTEVVGIIAHETMHVWSEFFHVPAARRAGTGEEQMAYLTGICAALAVNGTFEPRSAMIVKPGYVATTRSIDRSNRGAMDLRHEIAGYFSDGKTLQRDSASGRAFSTMCRTRLGDFFAP
jgi:hypothetical protein